MLAGCASDQQQPGYIQKPAHHAGNGFRNVYETPQRGFGTFLKWRLGMGSDEPLPLAPDSVPPYTPDCVPPDLERIRHPDPEKIQLTWIGHSSFLIQVDGVNILTDPVFSDRVSPVSFAGPTRQAAPGLLIEDLPPVDLVLISHDHYDHLDKPTIMRLGTRPRYLVPLGLKEWFEGLGPEFGADELDWWDSLATGPLVVRAVPAQHFSGRAPFRFNRTLWAGWVIESGCGRICFAGDTGFSPHFAEIRRRLGPMRLSLLPVGTYRPRWFMRPMHLDPPEAVKAHAELRSENSVGMHWGVFKQSEEPLSEPPRYLEMVLRRAGLAPDCFTAMRIGQTLVF